MVTAFACPMPLYCIRSASEYLPSEFRFRLQLSSRRVVRATALSSALPDPMSMASRLGIGERFGPMVDEPFARLLLALPVLNTETLHA